MCVPREVYQRSAKAHSSSCPLVPFGCRVSHSTQLLHVLLHRWNRSAERPEGIMFPSNRSLLCLLVAEWSLRCSCPRLSSSLSFPCTAADVGLQSPLLICFGLVFPLDICLSALSAFGLQPAARAHSSSLCITNQDFRTYM